MAPDPYTFNWAAADAAVDDARASGQQVLYILSGVPGWAGGGSNANIPPSDINIWINYVFAVLEHFSGRTNRPAAYEIWNEPDLENSGYGVGWNRNIDLGPLYVDYFVAAARIIRTHGALAVGPALSGGQNDRTRKIFLQLENTWYYDGNASDFVDVISAHANACCDSTHSDEAANLLRSNKLVYLSTYNPRNQFKPIWITEFGWKSGAIGEDSQRIRINNFLIYMTGSTGLLRYWAINHGFIYQLQGDCNQSRGIYYCSGTPKQVVTLYLQALPYPATQQTGYNPLSAQLVSISSEGDIEPSPLPREPLLHKPAAVEPEVAGAGRTRRSPCDQLVQRHGYTAERGDRDCRSFVEYQEEDNED